MSHRVSVALCTRNGERFVAEQLGSILDQSTPVDEIVVSDDDSSDGTLAEVRERLAGSGVEWRVLVNPAALGVTANFQNALSATTGDILLLSDQDDRWHPDHVARRLEALENTMAVGSDARLVDATGSPLGRSLFDDLEVHESDVRDLAQRGFGHLLRRNLFTGATMAFRRELLELARPFPSQWVHDEWLALIAAAVDRVRLLPDATVDYRIHGANQIGVERPTLALKVGRVLAPQRARHEALAERWAIAAARVAALPGVDAGDAASIAAKADFEARRTRLPAVRIARVAPVLAQSARYGRFASQGRLDMLRDVLGAT